jgi:hypothetical protein
MRADSASRTVDTNALHDNSGEDECWFVYHARPILLGLRRSPHSLRAGFARTPAASAPVSALFLREVSTESLPPYFKIDVRVPPLSARTRPPPDLVGKKY